MTSKMMKHLSDTELPRRILVFIIILHVLSAVIIFQDKVFSLLANVSNRRRLF